jgi:hypothetical protein
MQRGERGWQQKMARPLGWPPTGAANKLWFPLMAQSADNHEHFLADPQKASPRQLPIRVTIEVLIATSGADAMGPS